MRSTFVVVTVLLATAATVHAQADDDDDDDGDASSSAPSAPPKPTSIFHSSDDTSTCDEYNTGRRLNTRRTSRRDDANELLEAVAHANDPQLARRAYDDLFLTDEKGTPGEDFNKASDVHKEWATAHPDRAKWLDDPAHAKQFAETRLAVAGNGDDRLLQAASSAGDPLLLEKLHDLISSDDLTQYHDGWVQRHPDFVAAVNDPAKAKAFVDQMLVVIRGSDDEHRAWYAARHSPVPSLEARAKVALMLDGKRASLFDQAQDEWEKAHAKDLDAIKGDAATAFVLEHLGVGPAPATGTDDDHALYAAAVVSDDAALIAQVKRQLALVDFGGQTDQGDAFLEAHADWKAAHPPVTDKVTAAAYVRGHVKAMPWGFPEDNLKLYVAAKHTPEQFKSEANVIKGLKVTGGCDIHKFTGEADLYETEHPEFVATVAKPDAATTYVNGHLSVASYTDPSSMEGFALGVSVGIALPIVQGTDETQFVSNIIPFELDAEYRVSPVWSIGAFGSFGSISTSCATGVDCSGFAIRVGGELGRRLAPFNKYDPTIHFGAGWSHITGDATMANPFYPGETVEDSFTRDALGLHARANATLMTSGSFKAGPYASLQYSMFSDAMMVFAIGFGGSYAP